MPDPKPAAGTLNWQTVARYWPIILAACALLFMGAETRYQVQGLLDRQESDRKQWQLIRENVTALAALQEFKSDTKARLVGIEVDIRDLQRE